MARTTAAYALSLSDPYFEFTLPYDVCLLDLHDIECCQVFVRNDNVVFFAACDTVIKESIMNVSLFFVTSHAIYVRIVRLTGVLQFGEWQIMKFVYPKFGRHSHEFHLVVGRLIELLRQKYVTRFAYIACRYLQKWE